jgi:hypothetical protein
MASGGFGVAVTLAAATVLAYGSPTGTSATTPSTGSTAARAASATGSGQPVHVENAAFAIDTVPPAAVDITIFEGSERPDVDAIRGDLAKAGVYAEVLTDVPTCAQLAKTPGAPAPVDIYDVKPIVDASDHPFFKNGDLVYSVDTSADIRGTTLWLMFSGTLSTMVVERSADSSPKPNCMLSTSSTSTGP